MLYSTSDEVQRPSKLKTYSSDQILKEVQATIFEPHRRQHVLCIFYHFDKMSRQSIRTSLVEFANQYITSGYEQYEERRDYRKCLKENKFAPEGYKNCKEAWKPIINLFLSSKGFQKIFLDVPPEFPSNTPFYKGMYEQFNILALNDPDPGKWEGNWKSDKNGEDIKVDFMVLVADNNETRLGKKVKSVKKHFEQTYGAKYLFEEKGKKIQDKNGKAIEPFGFRDGLSRIPFWTRNKRYLLKENREIVLDDQLGSYLVFRKLEQNKALFDSKIKHITKVLFGLTPQDGAPFQEKKAFVEAQLFGRFKDGTPLALFDRPMLENDLATNQQKKAIKKFNAYQPTDQKAIGFKDDNGMTCPFHAHSRKTNPRNESEITRNGQTYGAEGKRFNIRIARRGIPYLKTDDNGKEKKEGMLFMCFQASIETQFKFMKKEWCNFYQFPAVNTGLDPVIGRRLQIAGSTPMPHRWLKSWDTGETQEIAIDFEEVVTFKGGEYFYTPSIPWLKNLAKNL